MYLAAAIEDGVAHVLDDARQAVCADVRMCIGEDGCLRTVLAENIQYLLHRTALLRARVEFSVGVGSGASLAEGVVALGIYEMFAGDACDVFFSLVDVLAAFHHDGAQPEFYQSQRREQPSRSRSDDDDLWLSLHVGIFRALKGFCGHRLVHPASQRQVHHDLALACIDASADDACSVDALRLHSEHSGSGVRELVFRGSHLGHHAQLYVLYHTLVMCRII